MEPSCPDDIGQTLRRATERGHAADLFHANGLIERDIRVSDAVLPAVNAIVPASRPAD
jgi:hypothetical protein